MEWIRCDRRRAEAKIWEDWLSRIPNMRNEFQEMAVDEDPLFYNETASVGLMASAAARSGLLALSEYSTTKRGDGRGRPHRYGRCDLWVGDPRIQRSWAFEFKQLFCLPNARRETIDAALIRACKDARAVHPFNADFRFGGVLVCGRHEVKLPSALKERIHAVAEETTFAFSLSGGLGEVYVLLRETS